MVRLAEHAKASLMPPRGETNFDLNNLNLIDKPVNINKSMSVMDQDYIVVSGHVDQAIRERITSGQYIDFSKLLPKDRIQSLKDGRMELVIRNRKTFWTPVSEGIVTNSFSKWEQAFRVFSNIYTCANPDRAGELIEYNHIIHSISNTFVWDNVYAYDKDFRLHIA